jgi:hypothetical protein
MILWSLECAFAFTFLSRFNFLYVTQQDFNIMHLGMVFEDKDFFGWSKDGRNFWTKHFYFEVLLGGSKLKPKTCAWLIGQWKFLQNVNPKPICILGPMKVSPFICHLGPLHTRDWEPVITYTSSTLIGGKGGAGPIFTSHYAWGTNGVCECKMDVKSTWIPTWHQMDHVSWSLGLLSKTISWR